MFIGISRRRRYPARHPVFELAEGEVHLWFACPDEWDDPILIASARDILDAGEIARMERLHFPAHRQLLLVSHVLLRTTLSRYADLRPAAWRFINNDQGKPRIDPAAGAVGLSFSLAHTAGLAVVGVARGCDVGVDVESMDRHVHARRLIGRFFSPEEAAVLEKLPAELLREQFPLYWTLKEAYIKALGRGLSHPLDSFTFRLTGGGPRRIGFSTADPPGPEQWRFALLEPRPRSIAAVCAACAPESAVRLRCYRAVFPGEAMPLACTPVGLSVGVVCPRPGNAASGLGGSPAPEPRHSVG
jgi:4'-phosphopantetheinyl transferase